jgi:CRP-like cAMP-binding protein
MFANWTINSISKLSYYFKTHTYSRKQFIYKEGDNADHVFISTAGEFRLYKTVKYMA